jgi:hypothetical protein
MVVPSCWIFQLSILLASTSTAATAITAGAATIDIEIDIDTVEIIIGLIVIDCHGDY